MDTSRSLRYHVYVRGRVQGVYFRAHVAAAARALDLAGWVRNLPDGRVEAVFEGGRDACERAVDSCRRGPPAALVAAVEAREEPSEGLVGFEIQG